MKYKLTVLLLALSSAALAQTGFPQEQPLSFSQNGGPVIEMHAESTDTRSPLWAAGSITVTAGNPHRIVLDQKDRILFAYDIQIKKSGTDTITIQLGPIDQKVRGEDWFSKYRTSGEIPTLEGTREFPRLKLGDEVQVDILYNPTTRERIYDVLKVASNRTPSTVSAPSAGETLSFLKVRVDIDGKTIGKSYSQMMGGAMRIYLPGRGNYYLGLSRHSKVALRAAGWVDHNTLRFVAGDRVVEIVGETNVLPQSDFATIWVYHEPASKGGSVDFSCGNDVDSLVLLNKQKTH